MATSTSEAPPLRHGHLVLSGGRYVFCSLRTRRGSIVEADSASQVFVAGDVTIGPKSQVGPAPSLDASTLEVFSDGARVSISRDADVTGRLCAPAATLQVTGGASLTGSFAADEVVAARITLTGLPSESTTTTTSSTTSTTSSTSTTSTAPVTTTTTAPSTTSSTTATTSTSTTSTTVGTTSTTGPTTTTSTAPTSTTTTTTATTAPPTTTTSTTSSTTTTLTTSTTSSTTTSTSTTTTTSTTATTEPSTTTTAAATTTTTTTSTTTTTAPSITSCAAGGQVDVIATLIPDIDTFSSGTVGGMEVDIGYPATVTMPGTGQLPVNDPSDPTTLIALLSATPGQINLYDGLTNFFDSDTAQPFVLRTLLTFNLTANVIFNQPVPFERARFTCTAGSALSVANFTCTVPQEVNSIGGVVPPEQRPPCVLTLAAP